MNLNDYVQASGRTVSGTFRSDLICEDGVVQGLRHMIDLGKEVDRVKKALYYGKPIPGHDQCHEYPAYGFATVADELHAILGMFTEVAELAEALFCTDQPVSDGKIMDEAGDLFWYLALLLRSRGINAEEVLDRNIKKLQVRYPDKFSADLAVNRNDAAEQEVFATLQ